MGKLRAEQFSAYPVLADPTEAKRRESAARSSTAAEGEERRSFLTAEESDSTVVFTYSTINYCEADNMSVRAREGGGVFGSFSEKELICYQLLYHTRQLQIEVPFGIYVDLIGKYSRFLYGMFH